MSNPSVPIQRIHDPCLQQAGVELAVVREDLRYPLASGNKWHKLKYALQQAQAMGHHTVVSCGGRWSNHLHALAAMGKAEGLKTIGLVRADEHEIDTACLRDAQQWGMRIVPVTRGEYRQRHHTQLQSIRQRLEPGFWIPEGGQSEAGIQGCSEIIRHHPALLSYDDIVCAVGTGTTMVGLGQSLAREQHITGYQVVKDENVALFIESKLQQKAWRLVPPSMGRYASISHELIEFMLRMVTCHQIPLEPVYTAKALQMVFREIDAGLYPAGRKIAFIHTGGLQGLRGYQHRIETLVGKHHWRLLSAAAFGAS